MNSGLKCLECKKWLTEEEVSLGFCSECYNAVVDIRKRRFSLCRICGKKLEGVDIVNAKRTCCPYCMTVISE